MTRYYKGPSPHLVSSFDQLVDIFTKSLNSISYDSLGAKLAMFDLYVPAWGEVLEYGLIWSSH